MIKSILLLSTLGLAAYVATIEILSHTPEIIEIDTEYLFTGECDKCIRVRSDIEDINLHKKLEIIQLPISLHHPVMCNKFKEIYTGEVDKYYTGRGITLECCEAIKSQQKVFYLIALKANIFYYYEESNLDQIYWCYVKHCPCPEGISIVSNHYMYKLPNKTYVNHLAGMLLPNDRDTQVSLKPNQTLEYMTLAYLDQMINYLAINLRISAWTRSRVIILNHKYPDDEDISLELIDQAYTWSEALANAVKRRKRGIQELRDFISKPSTDRMILTTSVIKMNYVLYLPYNLIDCLFMLAHFENQKGPTSMTNDLYHHYYFLHNWYDQWEQYLLEIKDITVPRIYSDGINLRGHLLQYTDTGCVWVLFVHLYMYLILKLGHFSKYIPLGYKSIPDNWQTFSCCTGYEPSMSDDQLVELLDRDRPRKHRYTHSEFTNRTLAVAIAISEDGKTYYGLAMNAYEFVKPAIWGVNHGDFDIDLTIPVHVGIPHTSRYTNHFTSYVLSLDERVGFKVHPRSPVVNSYLSIPRDEPIYHPSSEIISIQNFGKNRDWNSIFPCGHHYEEMITECSCKQITSDYDVLQWDEVPLSLVAKDSFMLTLNMFFGKLSLTEEDVINAWFYKILPPQTPEIPSVVLSPLGSHNDIPLSQEIPDIDRDTITDEILHAFEKELNHLLEDLKYPDPPLLDVVAPILEEEKLVSDPSTPELPTIEISEELLPSPHSDPIALTVDIEDPTTGRVVSRFLTQPEEVNDWVSLSEIDIPSSEIMEIVGEPWIYKKIDDENYYLYCTEYNGYNSYIELGVYLYQGLYMLGVGAP